MDPSNPQRGPLSEIGHLFLSSMRQRASGSAPRPVRVPPPKQAEPEQAPAAAAASDELSAEELAQVSAADPEASREPTPIPPVSAVIVQHLNDRASQRVREYARHLAANGQRVGVIQADASEWILSRFERSIEPSEQPSEGQVLEHFDQRLFSESMEEMNWDLDCWLLVLPNTRSPEARAILGQIDRWVVLATCDHDGVVSCYRTLKGLADVHHPRLSLALLDATNPVVAERIYKKLNNVCIQFLGIELEAEESVRATRAVAEHVAVHCRMTHDKGQLAAGAQWLMLTDFLARAKAQEALAQAAGESSIVLDARKEDRADAHSSEGISPPALLPAPQTAAESGVGSAASPAPVSPAPMDAPPVIPAQRIPSQPIGPTLSPTVSPMTIEPQTDVHSTSAPSPMRASVAGEDEVLDLAGDSASEEAIVSAVLSRAGGEMVRCPLAPPMCPAASLAVSRDRGLVLLAVAEKGLRQINAIAQAYRWVVENRGLIAMALPQFAIDSHQHPRLTLLVDHADTSATVLGPMFHSASVTVQAYRKLRWHGRTGLLLEAA